MRTHTPTAAKNHMRRRSPDATLSAYVRQMFRAVVLPACRQHSQTPLLGMLCIALFLLMLSARVAGQSNRVPAPRLLKAEVLGNLLIKFSWEPPIGWDSRTLANSTLDQYETYISPSTASNFQKLSTLPFQSNFQFVLQAMANLKPGLTYFYRVISVTCCGARRSLPICKAARDSGTTCGKSAANFICTDTDGIQTCIPGDGYAETSIVAVAEPKAPENISVSVAPASGPFPGKPNLLIEWNLPTDTGTAQRSRADVLAFKVMRSTNVSFFTSEQIFYGLPTLTGDSEDTYRYQIADRSSLITGVRYYYGIFVRNLACGPMNITCSPSIVGGRNATGVPSKPLSIAGTLLDSTMIKLEWQRPRDTGQGGGTNASTAEPLTGYIIEEDWCMPVANCLMTGANVKLLYFSNDTSALSFIKMLDSGATARTFKFQFQAQNLAGLGDIDSIQVLSLFFPSAPEKFTATINTTYGALRVFLSWELPDNTGQGPNNKVEPVTEYSLYQSDSPNVFNDMNAVLLQEGMSRNFLVTFPQKRVQPYYFMVIAANQLGYGNNRTASAFMVSYAIDAPLAPTALSAAVVGVRRIALTWVKPTDTGTGDNSRALFKYVLQQSASSDFSTVQSIYEPGPLLTTFTVDVPTSGPDPFFFRILANNEVGSSSYSNVANEQGVTLPGPPSNVVATTPGENFIRITWAAPLDSGIGNQNRALVSYRLEYFAPGVAEISNSFGISTLASNYTGLDETKNYTFRLYVQNDAGWSIYAEVVQQPIRLPTAPLGLVAIVQRPLTIRLTWSRPNNTGRGGHFETITSYIVEMDSNVIFGGNATFATISEKARGVNFCEGVTCVLDVFFSEARRDPYWFRVWAQNQLGIGPTYPVANEQSVQVPTEPTGVSVRVFAPRTVFLQWAQPSDTGVGGAVRALGNYILQQSYGDDSFSNEATLVNRSYSNRIFNATIILPSSGPTYFFFRVLTSNDAGQSGLSSSVQEQGVELPSEPILLSTQITTPLEISFSWKMSLDTGVTGQSRPLTGYSLQVAEEIGRAGSSTFNTTLWYSNTNYSTENQATSLKKLFSGLIKGRTYFFRVASKNDAGTGNFAALVSNEAISLPTFPIQFQAAVRRPFQIDLEWVKPSDTGFFEGDMAKIVRFELEQSTDLTFSSASLILPGIGFNWSFTAPNNTKGQRHYFRIWAVNAAGRSPYPSNTSEQAIDVPSAPTQLSIAITAARTLTVEWRIPTDTGLGVGVTPIRPIREYSLQVFIADTPAIGSTCSWPYSCDWTGYTNLLPDISYQFSNTTNLYIMTNLTKGKSYFVRLLASNDAGLGIVSDAVNKPALDQPNAPIVLSAFADKPLTINLTWALSTDTGLGTEIRPQWPMEQQRIQVATDAAFTHVINVQIPNITTNFAITGLQKGQYYYMRIFSRNLLGESVSSNTKTEHAISVPSNPITIQVVVSTARARELFLTWNFPTDTGLGGSACFLDCLASERQLTQIRIQRIDTNNPTHTVAAGTPQAAPVGTIDFTGHISYYFVPSGSWTTKFMLPLAHVDTDLLKGRTYYYRVFASNSAGESNASAAVYEMAIENPSPPLNLAIVISGELSLNTTWLPPLDNGDGLVASRATPRPLLKYIVQISIVSSDFTNISFQFDVEFPITKYRALAPTLVQGRTYYFRIIAQNAFGLSNASNTVNQTAILKPTVPLVTAASSQVTNPAEITFTWRRPTDTGAIGQYWPLLYFELQMSWGLDANFTNSTVLFKSNIIGVPRQTGPSSPSPSGVDTSINSITAYVYVVTGLSIGEKYYFRVFTENEAARSLSSFVATKVAVKLPGPPANFTITVTAPLKILVKFSTPEDTGAGGRKMPIERYILEFEIGDAITGFSTDFSLSPFGYDGCYDDKQPPCALTGSSPYDMGIDGMNYKSFCPKTWDDINMCNTYARNFNSDKEEWTVHVTGLTKARTYFFRVLAQNEAGMSFSTPILMEYGVDLPSATLGPRNPLLQDEDSVYARLDIIGILAYRVSFGKPIDTGLGDRRRALVSYGIQLVQADDEAGLTWPDSSTVVYVTGVDTYADFQNGVKNVTILPNKRYFVRAFAVNSAGRGLASGYDSNGPSFDYFSPNTGPAAGGSIVSVMGAKMGDSTTMYKMWIGGKECTKVYSIQFQKAVACEVPPGIPGKYGFLLYVDQLLLRRDSVFEYEAPQVESIHPSDGISVDGGVRVTVLGRNFGTMLASQEIGITSTRSDRCQESTWTSDSSMLCITSPVPYEAKINNSVMVRVNDIPSRPWVKGSILLYNVPAYYECSRDQESDCFSCGFPKCYEQTLALAQTLPAYPVSAGEVTEVCEEAVMSYCGYGLVSLNSVAQDGLGKDSVGV